MASAMKMMLGLLAFVTIGMIFGTNYPLPDYSALYQVAFIYKLEESHGSVHSSSRKMQELRDNGHIKLAIGISEWDKEAAILRIGLVKPEVISWSPRIIVLHSFLSMEECDYLRAIALPHLDFSYVVDPNTGKGVKSDVRTSSGVFLSPKMRKHPMIQAIEKRISVYAQVPVENGEQMQVLRYQKDQFYRPHYDYFFDEFNVKRGGQRIATMLMYLSDNVEGGETHFPLASLGNCTCGGETTTGLSVKPVKGNAILFWSKGLDGQQDKLSMHGACEVLSGEKWSATKWMREGKYGP